MARELPEQLGNRYRIDRLIAEGGMARVYQGTDTVLGRTVALKVLSANLASDPAFIARFEREAQAVASLNHPNLVGIYDIGSDGDLHYIVLEYVEGSTLDAVIRSQAPMDPDRVVAITLSVCAGLQAAHDKGIVHRDIKPANIMIEPDGRVKVMDFGIAKTKTEGLTEVGAVLGTVRYLAPEQAYGKPVDRRADIYAVGCVMYEMLTGRPPITGDTLMEMATKLASEEPEPPSALVPGIPAFLERVVMTALAKRPEDRYADTTSLARDLGAATFTPPAPGASADAGATIVQAPSERTRVLREAPPPEPPRRIGLLVAAVLLIAGGAIALAVNLLSGDERPPAAQTLQPPPPPPPPSPSPTPSESPSPSPTPTPTESPSPTPAETPAGGDPAKAQALRGAGGRISGILGAAVQSGQASERAADNIMDEVNKAISENDRGDVDDAFDAVEDARQEVDKYLDREELAPSVASAVGAQLNQMTQILGS
ncbi:MAG TPA: protein kinase [Actinomycetota bacterium]|nr:protein kinase [Actinomycetota bacterium]